MAHLVFQTAFPGDLFLSIPLLKGVRSWDPSSEIVLACRPGLAEFFIQTGLVDRAIEIDKKSDEGRRKSLDQLKSETWDVVFCPHQSPRTAAWIWSLRAKHKVGFAKWWNRFVFDIRVDRPVNYPDALRQLSLMAPLDQRVAGHFAEEATALLKNSNSKVGSEFFQTSKIPEWASMQVIGHESAKPIIFLAPGSVWPTKRWIEHGFVEVACVLLEAGLQVHLVGSRDEQLLCQQIMNLVKTRLPSKQASISSLAGATSLAELALHFSQGQALITNDSGGMHVASAVGLPTVAIFGPTTLDLGYRPWSNRAVVVQTPLDCRPCGKHGHVQCPLGTHACMKQVSSRDVIQSLKQLVPNLL